MCQSGLRNFVLEISRWMMASPSGRPVGADSNQIKTLTENNQRYNRQEIADILKISKSIQLLAKMKIRTFILQKKTYGLFGQANKLV